MTEGAGGVGVVAGGVNGAAVNLHFFGDKVISTLDLGVISRLVDELVARFGVDFFLESAVGRNGVVFDVDV